MGDARRDAARGERGGQHGRARAGQHHRAGAQLLGRGLDGEVRGGEAVTRSQRLHVDGAVAGVDHRGDRPLDGLGQERREERREGPDADDRLAGREADGAGRRQADPQAGIAARPDRHGDPVDRLKSALDPGDHPLDQRQQRLRVAARHRQRLGGEGRLDLLRHDAGGAGVQRCVDGQNTHAHSHKPVRTGRCLPAPRRAPRASSVRTKPPPRQRRGDRAAPITGGVLPACAGARPRPRTGPPRRPEAPTRVKGPERGRRPVRPVGVPPQ